MKKRQAAAVVALLAVAVGAAVAVTLNTLGKDADDMLGFPDDYGFEE